MDTMKKICGVLVCSVVLCGCSKLIEPATPVIPQEEEEDTPEATATPKPTPTPEINNVASVKPNTVTDYDREAVMILINNDLAATYGGAVSSLSDTQVTMSKQNAELTVTGVYYHLENYDWIEKPFTYVYKDCNEFYELVRKDISSDAGGVEVNEPPAGTTNTNGMTPTDSYAVSIQNSVSVSLSTSGGGNLIVQLENESGEVVSEMLNAPNPVDTTVSANVPSPGNYKIVVYLTGGSLHINYSTN